MKNNGSNKNNGQINELLSSVDEKLPISQLIIFGLQHVLVMCAGGVAVSLIIGNTLGLSKDQIIFLINADLLLAGIATLIQGVGLKGFAGARLPLIEGASMAAVNSMVAIGTGYAGNPSLAFGTIFCAVSISGLIGLLIAPFFGKLIRFFPKVVTGSVITIMGICLIPVAIKWAAGNNAASPDYASPKNIFLALFVLITILILSKVLKGVWNNVSILLGLIIGTVVATIFGMVDYSAIGSAKLIGLDMPFYFGSFHFDITAVISMTLVMLVIMTQATGNIIALHEIVGKPLEEKNLVKGLRAEGFSTMLGGIFNTFPRTALGQNIGVVNMTGVKSRYTAVSAGIILIVLGFFPKVAALVAAIPYPVLGGAGFMMFGMIMVGGIKSLGDVEFNGTKNGIIVAISIGIAMITLIIPDFYKAFPSWVNTIFQSGMTTGTLTAIILNIVFNELGVSKKVKNDVNIIQDKAEKVASN